VGKPTYVFGFTSGARAIAIGGGHACAITTGGALKCWGQGDHGQLGNGSRDASNKPVDVTGLGSRVVSVALGPYHSCALLAGGHVQCWGANDSGQLGNGVSDRADVLTPTDVLGFSP
jgi:alpha-tubulin suppressor-like RCC1 family protein